MSDQETSQEDATGSPQQTDASESAKNTGQQANTRQQANTGETSNTGDTETGTATKKTRARKQSTARKTRSVELTLTVTSTADGEWQAELTHSGKRVVQGLPIAASAVSKAASELHPDISETIESVLTQAREQHEAKLAELEAEVERVRKTLADLEG